MMTTTILYLLRHGETECNAQGIIQGHSDIRLNETGLQQAQHLGQRFALGSLDLLISSDLLRTMETARIIGALHHLPLQPDARWREIYMGQWEMHSWDEVMLKNPEMRQQYLQNWFDYKEHGGESWRDVSCRVGEAMDNLIQDYAGRRIAVVTHGGSIRMAVLRALRIELRYYAMIFDNTSITELHYQDQRWSLKRLNDSGHLGIRIGDDHGTQLH